jgi:predicted 3-demethylubiquinone-9 3-methyltransferase (glyoxalase superfamily)
MTVAFENDREKFVAPNGGSQYQFDPAISFFVHFQKLKGRRNWETVAAGGKESNAAGWWIRVHGKSCPSS